MIEYKNNGTAGLQATTRLQLHKLVLSALFIALGVVSSVFPFFSFPIGPSRCAPTQHLLNILGAVLLGPGYSVMNAFIISVLRNGMGTGTLFAFPGSMAGALLAGLLYQKYRSSLAAVLGEWFGTGILGSLLTYPLARLVMGLHPASVTFLMLPFLLSSGAGCLLALILLRLLRQHPYLRQIIQERKGRTG